MIILFWVPLKFQPRTWSSITLPTTSVKLPDLSNTPPNTKTRAKLLASILSVFKTGYSKLLKWWYLPQIQIGLLHTVTYTAKFTVKWFSLGTPVSSTNKTDRRDKVKILLKVVFNTIKP
jgi:hypothetical protein